ncbi:MAG: D-tyrosyl-tRNA(Tyr) deacylase [Verrucomicrobiales bacterium]|jgi:D-tyrosyl-tRNA(Tyr) deacylase
MRAVIQRVSKASVTINGEVRAAIGRGFVVLLGIEDGDGDEDSSWLVGKIAKLRVFDDADGNMNNSLADVAGEVLLISQFTLHASTKKGNRPSFLRAARPEVAVPIYEDFIVRLGKEIDNPVATGEFGADMKVALVNDGPVTISIDTKNRE